MNIMNNIYEELWSKIRDLIRLTTNTDEKYRKIKFNADDDLPFKKCENFVI